MLKINMQSGKKTHGFIQVRAQLSPYVLSLHTGKIFTIFKQSNTRFRPITKMAKDSLRLLYNFFNLALTNSLDETTTTSLITNK